MSNHITIPIILDEIRKGNPETNITILVATGFHRASTKAELRDKYGDIDNEKIVIYNIRDKDNLYKILKYTAKFNNIEILIERAHKFETDIIIFVEDSLKLLEEINKPSLGIALDTGHFNVNKESFSDAIRLLGDYIKHIHINDNLGYNDDHLIPGERNINFEKVILDLKKINYEVF